jgi:hypothetical protein
MKHRAALVLLLALSVLFLSPRVSASIVDDFPNLSKYLYAQPASNLYFGVGITPLSIMASKPAVSISIFQTHWTWGLMDFELFNASVGITYSVKDSSTALTNFTFRSSPKLRITRNFSIGPLIGYEFVRFSAVNAKIINGTLATPVFEPFSSRGLIYGLLLSETFPIGQLYQLKANQVFYRQTYSTTGTFNGWQYLYASQALNADQSSIAPGSVFQLEFSFLY